MDKVSLCWLPLAVLAGTKVKAADEASSHHIHTHMTRASRPAEKSSADEEMMQVGASSLTNDMQT